MPILSRLHFLWSPILVAGVLAGCAAGAPRHESHSHSMMSLNDMCAMHKQMMAGKTPAEQQAMMDDHMKSRSPEMHKHMQDLKHCK